MSWLWLAVVGTPLILAPQVDLWIQGQPGLHSETLSKKANQTKQTNESYDYQVKWLDCLTVNVADLAPDLHGSVQRSGDCGWPSLSFHVFSLHWALKIRRILLPVTQKSGRLSSGLGAFNQLDRGLYFYRHWAVGLESAHTVSPWSLVVVLALCVGFPGQSHSCSENVNSRKTGPGKRMRSCA